MVLILEVATLGVFTVYMYIIYGLLNHFLKLQTYLIFLHVC